MKVLSVSPQRALLLLVDLQPSLLRQVEPDASAVVQGANNALRYARVLGIPAAVVTTEPSSDSLDIDFSTPQLRKIRDSAFDSTDLDALIFQMGTHQVLLGGLLASSSITSTATDAFARNLPVTLIRDAIGDTSERERNSSLKKLKANLGQQVCSSQQFVDGLQAFDVPTLIGH